LEEVKMSISVDCPHCGKFVGILEVKSNDDFSIPVHERIKQVQNRIHSCDHPKPVRVETITLFGLLKTISVNYPETRSSAVWEEYCGPSSKFFLRVAIIFGTKRYPNGSYDGVVVNGKWAWWDFKTGFYGDGVAELANLHKPA
jgi:hypothetical protein